MTARAIKSVENVYFLDEFGAAEACWELEVENFQCVVAMDSHGASLFDSVQRESLSKFNQLIS